MPKYDHTTIFNTTLLENATAPQLAWTAVTTDQQLKDELEKFNGALSHYADDAHSSFRVRLLDQYRTIFIGSLNGENKVIKLGPNFITQDDTVASPEDSLQYRLQIPKLSFGGKLHETSEVDAAEEVILTRPSAFDTEFTDPMSSLKQIADDLRAVKTKVDDIKPTLPSDDEKQKALDDTTSAIDVAMHHLEDIQEDLPPNIQATTLPTE